MFNLRVKLILNKTKIKCLISFALSFNQKLLHCMMFISSCIFFMFENKPIFVLKHRNHFSSFNQDTIWLHGKKQLFYNKKFLGMRLVTVNQLEQSLNLKFVDYSR